MNESIGSADEIVNLNIDDLDVEELEQRLELATARADDCWSDCYTCGTMISCDSFGGNCTSMADCGTFDGC